MQSAWGIFSTEVVVRIYDKADLESLEKIVKIVKNEIDAIFERYISPLIGHFRRAAEDSLTLVHGIFEFDSTKMANYPWLHKIYWFYNISF